MSIRNLLSLMTAAVLTGCSGDNGTVGGINGTGKQITYDGIVVGVVDGFGSIIINNKRFDTDTATIFIDGEQASLAAIKTGMKVAAKVSVSDKMASEIHYQPNVSGPISSIDLEAGVFEIYGQVVRVTGDTVLDELTSVELVAGKAVEVSGDRNANSEIVARFIRASVSGDAIHAVGIVELAADGVSILVGGSEVSYQAAAQSVGLSEKQFAEKYLVPGMVVRVSATEQQVADSSDGDESVVFIEESDTNSIELTEGSGDGSEAQTDSDENTTVQSPVSSGGDGTDDENSAGTEEPDESTANQAALELGYAHSGEEAEIFILSVKPVSAPPINKNDYIEVLGTITDVEGGQVLMDGVRVGTDSETEVLDEFERPVERSVVRENLTVLVTGNVSGESGEVTANTIRFVNRL